jgi:dihydroorotase
MVLSSPGHTHLEENQKYLSDVCDQDFIIHGFPSSWMGTDTSEHAQKNKIPLCGCCGTPGNIIIQF